MTRLLDQYTIGLWGPQVPGVDFSTAAGGLPTSVDDAWQFDLETPDGLFHTADQSATGQGLDPDPPINITMGLGVSVSRRAATFHGTFECSFPAGSDTQSVISGSHDAKIFVALLNEQTPRALVVPLTSLEDDPALVRLTIEPPGGFDPPFYPDSRYWVRLENEPGGWADNGVVNSAGLAFFAFPGDCTYDWTVRRGGVVIYVGAGQTVEHSFEEGEYEATLTMTDVHGHAVSDAVSFTVEGGRVAIAPDELGGFYSAVKEDGNVRVSYFPAGAASRDLRAVVPNAAYPSLDRDDTGALILVTRNPGTGAVERRESRNLGNAFS